MSATDTFHHPELGHNCAQAVAYSHKEKYADPMIVEKMASCGGGRAPEGLCGALYAAGMACPERKDEITQLFEKEVGAIHCKTIKTVAKTPCMKCVEVADRLVEKMSLK